MMPLLFKKKKDPTYNHKIWWKNLLTMSSSKYNNFMSMNSEVVKDVMDITKQIKEEQENRTRCWENN